MARFTVGGRSFEMSPENTIQYTYLGDDEIYSHVFLVTKREGNNLSGTYVFQDDDVYKPLVREIKKRRLPRRLNNPEVPECDVRAFESLQLNDLLGAESVPNEWLEKPVE